MQFTEIEHKFVVEEDFDWERCIYIARTLHPEKETKLQVNDTYFLLECFPHLVLRHRHDAELQQLTLKTFGLGNESRTEIDLQLDQNLGNQGTAVAAFVGQFGSAKIYALTKAIHVFHFHDCELVYYKAEATSGERRRVNCIEFEAKHPQSTQDGLAIIREYEQVFGFTARARSEASLIELLYPELSHI